MSVTDLLVAAEKRIDNLTDTIIELRAELESVTNQMEEQAARFERGCYKQDEDGEVWDMCPVMEMANKQISQKDAELAAANKAVDEARELITKVSEKTGRYSRDPLTHASNIIEDNADAASAWLTAHPEKEQE